MKATHCLLIATSLFSTMACSVAPSEEETTENVTLAINGTTYKIAAFLNGTWFIDMNDNQVWDGAATEQFSFGSPGDIPLVWESPTICAWQGSTSGSSRIATYRPSANAFLIDVNGDKQWNNGTDQVINTFSPPTQAGTTMIPVIRFVPTSSSTHFPECASAVGFVRMPNAGGSATWFIDKNRNGVWDGAGTDTQFSWGGNLGDKPFFIGSSVGGLATVFNAGNWYVDKNANELWDFNCALDGCTSFGDPADKPFAAGPHIGTSRGGQKFIDMNVDQTWNGGDVAYAGFGNSDMTPMIGAF
jgi:hypothetical protein